MHADVPRSLHPFSSTTYPAVGAAEAAGSNPGCVGAKAGLHPGRVGSESRLQNLKTNPHRRRGNIEPARRHFRAEGNRTRNLLCPGADGANHHCGKISVNIPTVSSLCTHSLCTDLAAHFLLAAQKLPFTQTPPPTLPPPPTFPCVCVFTHGERVKCFRTCFSKLSPQTVVPTPRAPPTTTTTLTPQPWTSEC